MGRIIIRGGNRLKGTIRVGGSKNAALPILGASLLCPGVTVIGDVPRLRDVDVMISLLEYLGARVSRNGHTLHIDGSNVRPLDVSEELMRRMRASNLVLGPLLSRFGRVCISYPGGCDIGSRPMDQHLKAIRKLGADIVEQRGFIRSTSKGLVGRDIQFDVPSVGATENTMMAAVLAKGTTVIRNAAREPEISDLATFLNGMGAMVSGAGSSVIRITGVSEMSPVEHVVIPDRIEAGTHMIAAAVTGGDLSIINVVPEHVEAIIAKLQECGVDVTETENSVRVVAGGELLGGDVKTMPYPGFPTDMQPQFVALCALARGTSIITETIFENRFKHVPELRRMGADIRIEDRTAIVRGVPALSGTHVATSDLRAGAALVLAGLAAENTTVVESPEHIDRGYEDLEHKYRSVGADIHREL
ncbi:MAG: UDP-N-acetylglucosamine 1-carboxyvinyltransferase [Eubacteriales bacterium]|nr:UDP-N-acetylglucosamine 1-carboxyvinyltransferase [Bacillota bacterium]MBV1726976.1 UDP-N-acetylglucosamine 1-carboxyvinyltransferase [Desulforudis sp.]MDQ7788775.1 UDP-N-acetylglucosamine 1-carboxyvinyltransferase [Clostridia bacterium]MDZ4044015.1 UDP-N-acetylglucosamine 1-carboxyvinyltransferase [Eubacteriales bacterium]MBU4534020.1 UDP-N-acetylglucosamine 1-carboxyvinyltransferase [Bacillota bacterium]